jgi:predicted O-methyltransferase YrrM
LSETADFVFVERDWLQRRFGYLEFVRSLKYFTLKAALNLLLQNGGKLIVETGTQRTRGDPGGGSTTLFGAFCKRYRRRLITVDNNPQHLETSRECTEEFKEFIEYVLSDSVEFLRNFKEPIDLLYLDSLDCPAEGDATEAQQHNLRELKSAYKNLGVGSIVLIDDNNFANGGKSRLSKYFLLQTGEWFCILDAGQSLWVKMR